MHPGLKRIINSLIIFTIGIVILGVMYLISTNYEVKGKLCNVIVILFTGLGAIITLSAPAMIILSFNEILDLIRSKYGFLFAIITVWICALFLIGISILYITGAFYFKKVHIGALATLLLATFSMIYLGILMIINKSRLNKIENRPTRRCTGAGDSRF